MQETYKLVKTDPKNPDVKYLQGRINRGAGVYQEIANERQTFSIYDNNDWWKRRHVRSKFKVAANKIIYRNRADRVIAIIKLLAEERILRAKIAEEERLEFERLNKPKDPLQEMLDRLIPIEDELNANQLQNHNLSQNQNPNLSKGLGR